MLSSSEGTGGMLELGQSGGCFSLREVRVQSFTLAVVTLELEGCIAPLNLPSLSLEGPIFSWLCPRKPVESSTQSLLNVEEQIVWLPLVLGSGERMMRGIREAERQLQKHQAGTTIGNWTMNTYQPCSCNRHDTATDSTGGTRNGSRGGCRGGELD